MILRDMPRAIAEGAFRATPSGLTPGGVARDRQPAAGAVSLAIRSASQVRGQVTQVSSGASV
ncbi:hypothetical protein GCM10017771_00670 [Streptomyces capitiformicae]|uniref:Uncharacterized protein n=1 Tax=Streptomyces capitiformicae TaxID=2014920 RepID=A0A919GB55_9ACTN|nr:hypothetical protein GCM10017771_00670 [Streptomyces capitiformicae]